MTIVIDIRPLMGGKLTGVEVYIRHLLSELLRIDNKNTYILFANASSDQTKNFPKIDQKNVHLIQTRIPNKLLNLSLFFLRRPRLDKLIKGFKPDVWFLPDIRPTSLGKKVKKISVVHDLSFHHYPHFFSGKTRLWHTLLRPRKEIASSTKIIAVSEFTKQDLIKTYHVSPSKIIVIHEGIDENFNKNIDNKNLERVKKKYQLPDEYFLFLSTLEPRKNTERLLNAFKKYKMKHQNNLKLVMAGVTNKKIFSKLKLDPHPDVRFTGFIDEKDKAALFTIAKAFLYPSLFEGFGLPLLEAMKCNTPIITSYTSSMPEIVGDAAFLINPTSEEEIATAMEKIQEPERAADLKKKMAKRVKDFSWRECAEKTLKILTSL